MLKVLPRTLRGHARTGRSTRDTLRNACKAGKRHRGAAGLDTQASKRCAANLDEHLLARRRALQAGTSQPIPLRRGYMPQGTGVFRPLGSPAGRWRVAQERLRAVSAPSCAPPCHDRSQGLRRRRSGPTAMAQRVEWPQHGSRVGGEAARKGCCDRIPHPLLRDLVAGESAEGNIWRLLTTCRQAGVRDEGEVRPTGTGTPQGGGLSPWRANSVLHHLDWRVEERDDVCVRSADDCVVRGKTTRQAEKALEAGTRCVEDALGRSLHPDNTHLTTCGQGCDGLGDHVTARTLRMGGKAEARCKKQSKAFTKRSHHRDAAVVRPGNRVIRGTVRDFATAFSTCLGQCNALARWIRRRLRCMQYKRMWKTDNRRVTRRHIKRMGCVRCREVSVRARAGEETASSHGALSWGPPGVRQTHAGTYGELTPWRQRGGAGYGLPLTHWLHQRRSNPHREPGHPVESRRVPCDSRPSGAS
jgi:RNA-directed DNA polymerase